MIALDAARWTTLTHAYGVAADVPALLRHLARETGPSLDPESEPWFSLWSSLCHQGDVYDASYAALPHIMAIACEATGPLDASFFQLPAAIEIARAQARGPAIPADLAEAYYLAVGRLADVVERDRNADWNATTMLCAMAALAVAKGHLAIAEAVMNLDDNLIARLIALDFGDEGGMAKSEDRPLP